jgi:nickel transport protein
VRAFFLLLAVSLLTHSTCLAHRVNVFAYVDGGEIAVECGYSKSKPVNRGSIEVLDQTSGEVLLRGTTDEEGRFRFPVPEATRTSGNGLRIVLIAGEGHRNEWIVEASEYTGAAPASTPVAVPEGLTDGNPNVAERPAAGGLTRTDVEEVVNAALDAKLAPIKRAVLERPEDGPGLKEIVGGIGWIFGLVGIAAYFKGRPRV